MGEHAPTYVTGGEEYRRDTRYLPDRITAEPGRSRDPHRSAAVDSATWPVEPGRYRLVAARACPWANRSIIVRELLGLEPLAKPEPPNDAASAGNGDATKE